MSEPSLLACRLLSSLQAASTYYYSSIYPYIKNEGVQFEVIDLLAQKVGIIGMFSDWSGTTA